MRVAISLILSILFVHCASGQFDQILKKAYAPKYLFKEMKGEFKSVLFERNTNGNSRLAYGFLFSNKNIPEIKYIRAKQSELSDTSCSYFELGGQRINLRGHFINDFACDLDVATIKVYTASFNSRKYLLITSITSGSGTASTTGILNLFDITNYKSIIYYPLWSKFGGSLSFGDFDNDKRLDFMEIKPVKKKDLFKLRLLSFDPNTNQFLPKDDSYKILQFDGEKFTSIENKKFKY